MDRYILKLWITEFSQSSLMLSRQHAILIVCVSRQFALIHLIPTTWGLSNPVEVQYVTLFELTERGHCLRRRGWVHGVYLRLAGRGHLMDCLLKAEIPVRAKQVHHTMPLLKIEAGVAHPFPAIS